MRGALEAQCIFKTSVLSLPILVRSKENAMTVGDELVLTSRSMQILMEDVNET